MKILVICQYYYPEPFRITDICENLVKRGHDITVLTGLPNYPEGVVIQEYRHGNKKKDKLNGVNIIRCFEIGRGKSKVKLFLNYCSYAISATLKALTMKEKFDVVLVNQLSPILMAIPAVIYKKKHRKKILLYCLDIWPASLAAGGVMENSIVYKMFYKISRWIYKSSDMILVTSGMFKLYFENILKITNVDIKYLPQYAEDLFVQKYQQSDEALVVAEESRNYNFVFAGNIGEMQSVETIIKAANELKKIENIFFHIVGEGSKLEECKKLTRAFNIQNVIYYGRKPISEMPQFYDMADAMLITLKSSKALSYTLPGKVQSYMAAGKPIIGAINGETRRVIGDANCGFSCEAEDYKALASLIRVFCNSNEKKQMGKNALKFYLDNYNKEKFITTLEASLKDLEG